jgi:hypothetical protein
MWKLFACGCWLFAAVEWLVSVHILFTGQLTVPPQKSDSFLYLVVGLLAWQQAKRKEQA